MKTTTLDKLSLGNVGIISSLNCDERMRRRFLDLGLIPGTKIRPVLISPSGDPTAFFIRGTILAIREEDAKSIILE